MLKLMPVDPYEGARYVYHQPLCDRWFGTFAGPTKRALVYREDGSEALKRKPVNTLVWARRV